MTGFERDDDLEEFLRERTVLPNRLARAEHLEPPPELDRIVLARARQAIQIAHPEPPPPVYRPARWALPFGLAATLVIAFAVVLHLQRSSRTSNEQSTAGTATAMTAVVTSERVTTEMAPQEPRAPATQTVEDRSVFAPAKLDYVDHSDPERWLEGIQRLRRDGQTAAAKRELEAFRKIYPDYHADKTDPPR